MAEFRKSPVVIEAVQWRGENSGEIYQFINESPFGDFIGDISIRTIAGLMTASLNDWIVKGASGEFYPCKPEIFDESYESVIEVKNGDCWQHDCGLQS
jgi:hypothetical protein